jgi:hypothetical protein
MRKVFALTLLLASVQSFASVHAVSRTVKEAGKVSFFAAKEASYPVRHPFKSVKAVAHSAYVFAKQVI